MQRDRDFAAPSAPGATLDMWAGLECTVNRVGDRYFDQVERSGHGHRLADLDLFAALGIRALRYPVLWERTAPARLADADWRWPDERLACLRDLGITPIVGFLHHGSGPRHTHLLDPALPEALAGYARSVARRYPSLDRYTPVNEPLTTARFSALYGFWYPHARDGLSFARALLIQTRATILAMQAIRAVNSAAQLVQTEDLGKTFSTRKLAYQAEFENERRWLSLDLLCGRVDREHPMWDYLTWLGIDEVELDWFVQHPCPPDILGINIYLTSERFLDERRDRYPANTWGGNGRHAYADIEAVRVRVEGMAGPADRLREAWQRYHLPLAITEVHNGCTREEQLRWFMEIWRAATAARAGGIDVRAITAWALLGAYDWNSLVTRDEGVYEPGLFDVRAAQPRPTALARLVTELAAGRQPQHPVLASAGWWRRPQRLLYPPVATDRRPMEGRDTMPVESDTNTPPILITGATGTLGRAFARLAEMRGLRYHLLTRQDMDIADPQAVAAALDHYRPWAVVNTAGYVRVDDAEWDVLRCQRENVVGAVVLARACAQRGVQLLTFSSDLVFDGGKGSPYVESDAPRPLNVYGRTKAAAEQAVLAMLPSALVVRTSAFFGPWDAYNFVTRALQTLAGGGRIIAPADETVSPTYVPDLVQASLDLLIDGERGVWHLANQGAITWADLARQAAEYACIDGTRIDGVAGKNLDRPAERPRFSVLGTERGALLPSLDDALARYVVEGEHLPRPAAEDGEEEQAA